MRPSTRNLAALPAPAALEQLCRRLALLDALLSPDWEFRYYSFNREWDAAVGQRLGSMRNGSGDEWYAVFQEVDGVASVFLYGFAHEAPIRDRGGGVLATPPGMFDGVPEAFRPLVDEPSFGGEATFACWNTGDGWRRGTHPIPEGPDPDGSAEMLGILVDDPIAYKAFALDYHEVDLPLDALRPIYADLPLDRALAERIAPEVDLDELAADLAEIGWPVG